MWSYDNSNVEVTNLGASNNVGSQKSNKTLPEYLPSLETKIASRLNFSTKSLLENHDELIKTYLNDFKINKSNIHLVYKMLLEIEDLTQMAEYLPLVQENVKIHPTQCKGGYWIKLKNGNIVDVVSPLIDEVVLVPTESFLKSSNLPFKTDILLKHPDESNLGVNIRRRSAIVQAISDGRVHFQFPESNDFCTSEIKRLPETKYNVIFRSHRFPVRVQHNALMRLNNSARMRMYLFPSQIPYSPQKGSVSLLPLHLLNKTIGENREQLIAVQNVISEPNLNAPFIIFGPPGTGKTTVVVESILQLLKNNPASRILVTASSNSACDTTALRICKYLNTDLLSHKKNSLLRIYSNYYILKNKKLIDKELLDYSNEKNNSAETGQYRIIAASLCTVGKLVTCGNIGKHNYFTHIFLDEAGATTIPEALIAIMCIRYNRKCRLILSGDHKQLGPVVRSERAAQLGLSQSIMEHFLKFDCYSVLNNGTYDYTLQARLRHNYRSHPEILRLFNHLFYEDELIAAAKEEYVSLATKWDLLPNPKFPFIFQAVHGVVEQGKGSPSSFNMLEVKFVMWFVNRLLRNGINGKKMKQSDIGIITPYKLQNQRIQACLKACGWLKVESSSVEAFQGREKQIIIVSLVKSRSGFVSNPKYACVRFKF